MANVVKLGNDWITALFGQDRTRRNASITSESRGSDANHLCSMLVLLFAVEMKCLEGWQFVVDHRCRSELLTLMLRLMMMLRLRQRQSATTFVDPEIC